MLIVQLLLKLFFPSWNFFDRFESYFELEVFDQQEWRKVDFFSERKLSALLLNPKGNYELFLRTQLDRFVDRLVAFKTAPDAETIWQLGSYRILQTWLKSTRFKGDLIGAHGFEAAEAPPYFPLRIFQCRGQEERKLVIEIAGGA